MFSITLSQKFAIICLATQMLHLATSSSLNLVAPSLSPSLNLTKPNCHGSIWCPKFNFASNRINLYLQNWIKYTMSDSDIYFPGVQIACATVTILLPPLGTNSYCAYTAGHTAGEDNIPAAGINGSVIKGKMDELRIHGCFACGSVMMADSDGSSIEDEAFKIDYVPRNRVKCGMPGDVVCPPSVPSEDRTGLEQGERPVLSTFNVTFDDGAVTLQALNIQNA